MKISIGNYASKPSTNSIIVHRVLRMIRCAFQQHDYTSYAIRARRRIHLQAPVERFSDAFPLSVVLSWPFTSLLLHAHLILLVRLSFYIFYFSKLLVAAFSISKFFIFITFFGSFYSSTLSYTFIFPTSGDKSYWSSLHQFLVTTLYFCMKYQSYFRLISSFLIRRLRTYIRFFSSISFIVASVCSQNTCTMNKIATYTLWNFIELSYSTWCLFRVRFLTESIILVKWYQYTHV